MSVEIQPLLSDRYIEMVAKIRQIARRKYTGEEKIRIVLGGLRGEIPILEQCLREGIAPTMDYRWSKALLDAGITA
jgi:transposase